MKKHVTIHNISERHNFMTIVCQNGDEIISRAFFYKVLNYLNFDKTQVEYFLINTHTT